MPGLIPLAAVGLLPIMVGATVVHVQRAEHSSAVITAILFALLAFVAYQRWRVRPILPRRSASGAASLPEPIARGCS